MFWHLLTLFIGKNWIYFRIRFHLTASSFQLLLNLVINHEVNSCKSLFTREVINTLHLMFLNQEWYFLIKEPEKLGTYPIDITLWKPFWCKAFSETKKLQKWKGIILNILKQKYGKEMRMNINVYLQNVMIVQKWKC